MTNPRDIALQFAPRFKVAAETRDIPMAVDFDGDWDVTNNPDRFVTTFEGGANVGQEPGLYRHQGASKIYYSLVSSKTHHFLTYYAYFPLDDGIWGHSNDASSIMMIVRKGKTPAENALEWVISSNHSNVAYFRPDELFVCGGHALIEITPDTHGMEPVEDDSPSHENDLEDAACPAGSCLELQAAPPPAEASHRYDLMDIQATLWSQRHNTKVFCDAAPNREGAQYCASTGEAAKDRGDPAYAPWARSFDKRVNAFQDPIRAFKNFYFFNRASSYSLEYAHHPYQTSP